MPTATKGTLIECDPSIHALIILIDRKTHDIIIEELDDTHLFVDSSKVDFVKKELAQMLDQNTFNPVAGEV